MRGTPNYFCPLPEDSSEKPSVPGIIFDHMTKLYYTYSRNNLGVVIPCHLPTMVQRNLLLFLAPLAADRQIVYSTGSK